MTCTWNGWVSKPVGDIGKTIQVDVRVISATNRDLIQEVHDGKFREDLFYRLSVIKVKLPSLVSRKSDIPELVDTRDHRHGW